MRKTFTIFMMAALGVMPAVAEDFATAGDGTTYSFEALSGIEGSGVTKDGTVYRMANTVTISQGDKFVLDEGILVEMDNDVALNVECNADFDVDETVLFTRSDETSEPKGISVSDNTEIMKFRNVNFEYCQLRTLSDVGISVEDCDFKYAVGALSSSGALSFGGSGSVNTVKNCRFEENTVPAMGAGANIFCSVTVDNCYLYDNNSANTNKPQINLTAPGDGELRISNCEIVGNKRTMVGGIAVGNMLQGTGANKVVIENNKLTDHRYGITAIGPMDIDIIGNTMIDNKYETNPMNGGSGISIYDSSRKLTSMITGNHIEGSLWGVTIIGGKDVNMGKVDDPNAADYNPGNNVFVDNGNNGVLYDLYNNTDLTVYAQGNTWNVDEQTAEKIETVIFHKNDDAKLGEVIYMPAGGEGSVSSALNDINCVYSRADRAVLVGTVDAVAEVYSLSGALCGKYMAVEGRIDLSGLAAGLYLVKVSAPEGVAVLKCQL